MADGGGLRVLVALRSDAASKPGGDVSLLKTFADQLAERHRVEVVIGVPGLASLEASDVVLTANLDRPVEPAATLARAERVGTTMVHYALHHPAPGVEAYLANGAQGFRRQLGRLAGGSPIRYEQLLWTLHAGSDLLIERRRPAFGSVARSQRDLLASARVVVSSEVEAEAIARDIGPLPAHHVVAHPTDHPAGRPEPVAGRVVVPGRVEGRKNQLLALRLAHRFPDEEFLFVGGVSPSDGRYGQRFLDGLASTPNATHVAHLPKDDFYPLLLSAEAVLSASWFEVTSLIELYCADHGVPLAVSQYSYLDGDGIIHRFDPADDDAAAAALTACLAATRSAGGPALPGGQPSSVATATPATTATTASRTIVDVVEGCS